MKRQILENMVTAMFVVIVLAFVYVLFRSLSSGSESETELFQNLPKGETAMRRLEGRRAWVSHLSEQQKQALRDIPEADVLVNTGCSVSANYCIVDAATNRAGIEMVYSSDRPTVMLKSKTWKGGFIDPDSGAIYDLLGRAYHGHSKPRALETRSR